MAALGTIVFLPLLVACAAAAQDGYYWPKRSADAKLTGTSPHVGPRDFAAGPAWTWDNPDDELMRHGPLIDDKKNVYLVTAFGVVRKFSPDGKLLWKWQTTLEEGKVVACGALYNGSIYIASNGFGHAGFLLALGLETGEVRLRKNLPHAMGIPSPDSHNLVIHDGVAYLPSRDAAVAPPWVGNNKVVALSAATGELLWVRMLAGFDTAFFALIWNFMPAFPGDGTLLFATPSARAYRLNASNGEIIWQAQFPEPGGFAGTGGGALSPDGRRFFALGAYRQNDMSKPGSPIWTVPPCFPLFCYFGEGVLIAYDVQDGRIHWARRFLPGLSGQQYPAVGGINGPGSRTAVFVGLGINTMLPSLEHGENWLPIVVRRLIGYWQPYSQTLRRLLEVPVLENHVMAVDAETGADIWQWKEVPWDYHGAAGDERRFQARIDRLAADPRHEPLCGPDNWGIPTIGGDGTVYASSGHTGNLYAIRDANGDGRIQEGEVSTFETHNGFLNGPSLAPGMLAASPCWGPMYVFKS